MWRGSWPSAASQSWRVFLGVALGAFLALPSARADILFATSDDVPGGGEPQSRGDATVSWGLSGCQTRNNDSGTWPPRVRHIGVFPSLFNFSTTNPPTQTGDELRLPGFGGRIGFFTADGHNWLSASFSNGVLTGRVGGTTMDLTVSASPTHNTLIYTSDFVTFSNTTSRSMDLTFSLSSSSPLMGPSDLENWQAVHFHGAFSSTPEPQTTPEPATLAMATLGLVTLSGVGLAARKRRRNPVDRGC